MRQRRQAQLFQEFVVLRRCRLDCGLDLLQFRMGRLKVDLRLSHRRADVAGDVQVEVVLLDLVHLDPAGVAGLFLSELVGVDDLGDVLLAELVLAFAFVEVLRAAGVDEEHVVGLLAFLEHEDADGDAGGVEEVCGQADDGVDVAVVEQLGADAFLGTATEEHAVRQDDCHHAFVFQVVEAVEEEGEVGGGLGGEAVAFEAHVVGQRVGGFPALAEGRVGDDGVEARLLRRVRLPHHVLLVEQGIAVEDVKLRVLHPVQQHVHAGEVVGGDVLLLTEDLADGAACLLHFLADDE